MRRFQTSHQSIDMITERYRQAGLLKEIIGKLYTSAEEGCCVDWTRKSTTFAASGRDALSVSNLWRRFQVNGTCKEARQSV